MRRSVRQVPLGWLAVSRGGCQARMGIVAVACTAAGCRTFALDCRASVPHLHHSGPGETVGQHPGGGGVRPRSPSSAVGDGRIVTADAAMTLMDRHSFACRNGSSQQSEHHGVTHGSSQAQPPTASGSRSEVSACLILTVDRSFTAVLTCEDAPWEPPRLNQLWGQSRRR